MKLVALYVSTARYGVNGISLHHTDVSAYGELVSYLQIGHENDPRYADDIIPADIDDLIDWCDQRAEEQGCDYYCTEVEVPPPE